MGPLEEGCAVKNPYGLTFRECEVLEELIRLGSPKAVAASEGLCAKTVRNHMRSAVKKIGVATALQAAVHLDRRLREMPKPTAPSSVFATVTVPAI